MQLHQSCNNLQHSLPDSPCPDTADTRQRTATVSTRGCRFILAIATIKRSPQPCSGSSYTNNYYSSYVRDRTLEALSPPSIVLVTNNQLKGQARKMSNSRYSAYKNPLTYKCKEPPQLQIQVLEKCSSKSGKQAVGHTVSTKVLDHGEAKTSTDSPL